MNSYTILRDLCSVTGSSALWSKKYRVEFIKRKLRENKIPFSEDRFIPVPGVPDWSLASCGLPTTTWYPILGEWIEDYPAANILVEFFGKTLPSSPIDRLRDSPYVPPWSLETTVFLAHYDVATNLSQNCQDNSASVANLLELCIRLSKSPPSNRVVVAFVDLEERVQPEICGAQRLAQQILKLKRKFGKVRVAINLELTAQGTEYWVSVPLLGKLPIPELKSLHRVESPYNDACVLAEEGIPSVCIGALDKKNLNEAIGMGHCDTWSICHSLADTFEDNAVEADMNKFVDLLESLVSPPPLPGRGKLKGDSKCGFDPFKRGTYQQI
jgi:hypothetical protein